MQISTPENFIRYVPEWIFAFIYCNKKKRKYARSCPFLSRIIIDTSYRINEIFLLALRNYRSCTYLQDCGLTKSFIIKNQLSGLSTIPKDHFKPNFFSEEVSFKGGKVNEKQMIYHKEIFEFFIRGG